MGSYNFDIDLQKAKVTEAEVAKLLRKRYGDIDIETCDTIDYDIRFLDGNDQEVTIEIKEDFSCMNSGNVCLEYWCRGKPSGIDATKAKFFLYKIHVSPVQREFYICTSEKLRKLIADGQYLRKFENKGDPNSGTCGYLFRLTEWRKFATRLKL